MILPGNVDPARAVRSNREREMAVFDAMPDVIKELVREAPENYSLVDYGRALVKGAPIRAICKLISGQIAATYAETERRIQSGEPPSRY